MGSNVGAGVDTSAGIRRLVTAGGIVLLTALAACSSAPSGSAGTWRGSYFLNSDRVWEAIEDSLDELGYEVTEKNRYDGVIRARSAPTGDGSFIVLEIDQVVHTEDQVNVFVKPSFGDGGTQDPASLNSAAESFMTQLNAELNG